MRGLTDKAKPAALYKEFASLTDEYSKLKISLKSGFYRLWIVLATLWLFIGSWILIASGVNFDGFLGVILPPPITLAFGWVCSWVFSGFMQKSECAPKMPKKFVSELLAAYLNEALKWVYVQAVNDLRNDGCEIHPSEMPEDMRSAFVQYLFGATLAMEEDLNDARVAYEWVVEARLQTLQWIIIPVDEQRALIEVGRFNGGEPNDFSAFIALGASSMRSIVENSKSIEDMKVWAGSYKSGFLTSARIFTNYR